MSLRLHRAERTDLLADGLASLLEKPLADPFAQEVVVVPARGVERWLTQRLSHRLGVGARGGDGVCAGVRFLSPHSLVSMLIGRERDDPWDADRLVWTVLEVVDESLGEQWCTTLATHLGHEVPGEDGELRRSRRFSVARRIAGLFTSYAAQRPQLLTDWREGHDTDGCASPLDPDLHWQAELWRRVVARRDVEPPDVRHERTLAALAAGGDGLDLPDRLSLFGHTRLPCTEVQLLGALGALRDVHLWLPQPSGRLWDDLVDVAAAGPVARADDRSAEHVHHPLLASLGRDSRELQRNLALADGEDSASADTIVAPETLLGHLQADLRGNATPTPRAADPKDATVQVHACHGPSRQVDVLREVLVGLLADDPTLEPRDILVMCPDIETYAPLIQAGFGLGEVTGGAGHPAHRLRVRLADRALSSTNPLLAVAARLVEVAGGRVTATEVLDLLASAPVRQRFALDEDDLDQVSRWVGQAGIRWGMDAAGRADYALGRFGQNTWRAGLDRVLLGVAMAEDEHQWLGAALPVDDVSSGDIDLVGRLAEYVDRLDAVFSAMADAHSVQDWVRALGDGVLALTDVERDDAWQVAQFDRELATIRDAVDAVESTELRHADVRNLLAHRLSGRPTRANFRTGTLTVCTMVPMRSVPHRVVCLIGLDDGVFPRTGSLDGDDVLARSPQTGERDVRSEDRQLLLDAVLAATERLVVTYTGANEQTGAERPPAVPLGELLDAVARTAPDAGVLTRHPLQPFDRRNLEVPGLTDPDRVFSFDRAAAAGARAAVAERTVPGPLIADPLPAWPSEDVALEDLQQFFAHPARAFLRRRLDVSSPLEAEETLDAIPIELDPLEKWGVGDRLLRDVLDGLDPVSSMTAEQLRGLLPPALLGQQTLRSVVNDVQALVQRTDQLRQGTPRSLDVDVDLGDGRRLTGTVSGIRGNRIVSVTYSSLRARQRLESWINLLTLSASRPDDHWIASAVGKGKAGPQHALAGPLDHRAVGWLRELVDLHDRGLREPLPLPLRTGLAYAEASVRSRMGDPKDPVEMAEREWRTDRDRALVIPGEQDDAAHVRLFGDGAPISVLTVPPRADEDFNDEPHRLGQYAWRVWSPLLSGAEQVSSL
ncbi:exodeoxyribonuclease V subunit gamma [Nocardioides sp. JQ2195]|uniref:exodeoxyribonuclease V subunit gamma n=1 Tax=Nocardioides sp. JQ2195 TaxID=2592334 RepID=UPI00143EECEB|nr:exodeoxyribonuclease V subunit gamma [Nocardioides sp. JQ2195]QIX25271.1 exodeoxyribonuclease V subunit gamma [Nocardioides sp. JQ2195]